MALQTLISKRLLDLRVYAYLRLNSFFHTTTFP